MATFKAAFNYPIDSNWDARVTIHVLKVVKGGGSMYFTPIILDSHVYCITPASTRQSLVASILRSVVLKCTCMATA